MESTGSNMPMKMVPMKPAIKNRSKGSANATAVFRLRSRSPSVTVGDAHQFGVQFAAFFGDGNHFQDGTGKQDPAIGQALAESPALLHALDGLAHGIHQDLVADGAPGDIQTLDQLNARADQRAEHPAKPRHGKLRDQRSDQRRFQNEPLPTAPAFFGDKPGAQQKSDGKQPRRQNQTIRAHQVARANDELRDQGQRTVHVAEDGLKFWNEKRQQQASGWPAPAPAKCTDTTWR